MGALGEEAVGALSPGEASSARRALLEATIADTVPHRVDTFNRVGLVLRALPAAALGSARHDSQYPCLFFLARAGRHCSSHLGRATIVSAMSDVYPHASIAHDALQGYKLSRASECRPGHIRISHRVSLLISFAPASISCTRSGLWCAHACSPFSHELSCSQSARLAVTLSNARCLPVHLVRVERSASTLPVARPPH